MIAVIDYGAGNLRNVCKALDFIGADIVLTDQPAEIERADKVVLPGVGAFADCMQGLQKRDLLEPLMDFAHSGRPFLGICVGMQLLFDVGEEMGEWPGLGLVPGRVVKFKFDGTSDANTHPLKIPHIGWNQVEQRADHPILRDVTPDGYAYFVHSFHAKTAEPSYTITTTHYGYDFPSVVAKDNVWGIQFHPEKSQDVGLQMLKNFIDV
nr:imidazole glycerol phosphate synthase, glutamine amidotransferase subunit [uncultured bacterium]